MKNDVYDLPDDLSSFAQIISFPKVIEDLAEQAEEEDWTYRNTAAYNNSTINSYFSKLY